MNMVSKKYFNRDFKIVTCQTIISGQKSKAQVCRELGVSPSVVDRWVDQFKVRGEDSFPNSQERLGVVADEDRVKELEALVGRLTLEKEFLQAALKKGAFLKGTKSK